MKRNRKNSIKKERIIMLASSAFVLTALTMTGIYMKNSELEAQDDGYTLDFTAMENNAEDKFEEIAQNSMDNSSLNQVADGSVQNQAGNTTGYNTTVQQEATEGELDYMPLEVGSGLVEIPGLTEQSEDLLQEQAEELTADSVVTEEVQKEEKAVSAQEVVVERALHFTEGDGLLRPVSGDVLIPYSMDKSVYFTTLDQYKYNPAVMISAAVGTEVVAGAEGKVVSISENEEIGKSVVLNLGDGYQAVYGQLNDVKVSEGEYVDAGDVLGLVAEPTKYYSAEGANVYFQVTKDGAPVNPEGMF